MGMTLAEFVEAVNAEAPVGTVGGMQDDGVCVDAPIILDPLDLDAITKEALRQGIIPPDTDWSDALRIVDEAFQNTP